MAAAGVFGLPELIEGAQEACDKVDDTSVSSAAWRRYINRAILSLFRKVASQFADTWISTVNFTLAGGEGGNVYTFGSTFEQLRHLTLNPGTNQRIAIRPFNLQELDDFRGDPRYRLMGRALYLEPPERAAGNYRAWFVPRPTTFEIDFPAAAATISPLPSCVATTTTLTASVNSALPDIDGVTLTVGALVIIKNQDNPIDNGLYVVTSLGSGSTKWVLTRGDIETGFLMQATAGTFNALRVYGASFVTAGVTAWTWTETVLDIALDTYREYVEEYAAALALEREQSDSSQQRARCAEIEADIEVMASSQEAGGQVAIADVDELQTGPRRSHPLP